ncbi:hypothetical protein [Micromonospora deserti]|uniref:Uncharacterized protein n=1 Tax=Micromonospora deserti TaxID=2070366 RepID=A0A2W2DRY7_9ACTN|nr:hypothetical protein [Micromonospora deserti]PZG02518.1 hypothetical protein C1I99_02020 [Micromonospora deserti]
MTRLVVVYDGACGDCSAIAARLSDVLAPEVLTRSCRDPHLATEFPVLAGHLRDRPCRRPLMIVVRSGGRAEVASGWSMLWVAAGLVAPRRWRAALRLALRVIWGGIGRRPWAGWPRRR